MMNSARTSAPRLQNIRDPARRLFHRWSHGGDGCDVALISRGSTPIVWIAGAGSFSKNYHPHHACSSSSSSSITRRTFLNGNFFNFLWKPSPSHMGSQSQPEAMVAGASATPNGSQLLDEAAAEGLRIFDRIRGQAFSSSRVLASTSGSSSGSSQKTIQEVVENQKEDIRGSLDEKIKYLEDAADSLLGATEVTIPLAQIIVSSSANDDRVRSLHKAFLSLIQECVSALAEAAVATPASSLGSSEVESPLLNKTLRLAVRAREDLGLPLHTSLYRSLAASVAQYSHSSSTITQWTRRAAEWTHEDCGHDSIISQEQFFALSLCHLARRKRFDDLADVLLLTLEAEDLLPLEHLSEATLQDILRIIYPDLQALVWDAKKPTTTPDIQQLSLSKVEPSCMDTQALQEILDLLGPSIWKIFGYISKDDAPKGESDLRNSIDYLLGKSSLRPFRVGANKIGMTNMDPARLASFILESPFAGDFFQDMDESTDEENDEDIDEDTDMYSGKDLGSDVEDDCESSGESSHRSYRIGPKVTVRTNMSEAEMQAPEVVELFQDIEKLIDKVTGKDIDEDTGMDSGEDLGSDVEDENDYYMENQDWTKSSDRNIAMNVAPQDVFIDNKMEELREDDESDEFDDGWSDSTLYTRSNERADIPDVVHQVEQVIGKSLKYREGLEDDMVQQLRKRHGYFDGF